MELKIAKSTELTLLSSNANFAALYHSGSVGVTLTFASLVIKSSVVEIMFLGKLKISCQNVLEKTNARSKSSILPMVKNTLLGAVFVEMLPTTIKISEVYK